MKKAVFIAMAALALLTAQCKKNEPKSEEKVMVPITGTVDFGGGSKTEITTTGCITPVVGDKIYIYDSGGANVGYMNCTAVSGQQFDCSGEIEQDRLGKTCSFMYLGFNNGVDGESETISFADQTGVSVVNGKISGLEEFHVGGCTATVSQQGTVTLPMLSVMAIAYFQLNDVSGDPIANQDITVSGISATATINKAEGTLTGSGTGTVDVHTDADGRFYMALIPQRGAVTFSFAVGVKEGQRTFYNGISPCSFYSEQGLGSPLQVEMEDSYVNLGLPSGRLWATCNVGANSPEEYGDYFMWGSATPNTNSTCDWEHAPFNNGSSDYNESYFVSVRSTVCPDDKLASNYDAARAKWGGDWRMPTKDDWQELYDNTTNRWTTEKGVKGRLFTSENGATLFLPAAGYRVGTSLSHAGSRGGYWSSSLGSDSPLFAYSMYFDSGYINPWHYYDRCFGFSVRPVR